MSIQITDTNFMDVAGHAIVEIEKMRQEPVIMEALQEAAYKKMAEDLNVPWRELDLTDEQEKEYDNYVTAGLLAAYYIRFDVTFPDA